MPAVRVVKTILPLLAAGWNVAGAQEAAAHEFEYLRLEERALVVTHSLASRFEMPASFSLHAVTHRTAHFNGVPFEISLSAFVSELETVMIHAEHVADGSGASNYNRFPVSDWPQTGYRSPGANCQTVPASVVGAEHDLLWLRERGFEPSGEIWLEQHFLSGISNNDEIVVTLLVKGVSCDDASVAATRLAMLRALLSVAN